MEMIAVILPSQPIEAFLHGHPVTLRHPLYLRHEAGLHLLLRDTADAGVFLIKRYVLQLVEVAEDADLAELRHAGKEHELQVVVVALQGAEEPLEHGLIMLLKAVMRNGLKQRLVVLIDKHHRIAPRLLHGLNYQMLEARCKRVILRIPAINQLPLS